MQLTFDRPSIKDDAWYPTADLTGFRSASGGGAEIQKALVISFTAPGKPTGGDVNVEATPWRAFGVTIEASEVGGGIFDVKLTLSPTDGEPINTNAITKVRIGVNKLSAEGPAWSSFEGTFAAAADEDPQVIGKLVVDCASAPLGLELVQPEVRLTRGEKSERLQPSFGQQSSFDVTAGTYRINAPELRNAAGTLRASVALQPDEVVIRRGESTDLSVRFGSVVRSTTVDVSLDFADIPGLCDEEIQLSYLEGNTEKHRFVLRSGQTHRMEMLPLSGSFTLRAADVRLNNIHYQIDDYVKQLDGQYHLVKFTREQVRQMDDSHPDAAKFSIGVSVVTPVAERFTLRLVDHSNPPRQYRFDDIRVDNYSAEQAVLVAPGAYEVVVESFIFNSVVHYIDVQPNPLSVVGKVPARVEASVVAGANLHVPGFPNFLSFGGCANMSPSNVDDFAAARVSSLFKYSGDDGMGDAGHYLPPGKEPTPRIIQMARDVSAKLNDALPVLPVMISYTCNLSLGNVEVIIRDPERHKFSFANYIQALQMAQATQDPEHPVPAGFIVNPDYLGECQKYGFAPTYAIPVRQPLASALEYHGVDFEIPSDITDTLKGYVKAVNWLTRVIAPSVVLGWQLNLWGVAGSQWVYRDFEYAEVFDPVDGQMKKMTITPERAGELMAQYALLVGVFDDIAFTRRDGARAVAKGADFMAVDRYEADDFTIRSYANGYCYSPYEWERTFDFCAVLSRHLRKPVMPWQIPASHLATTADQVDEPPRVSASGNICAQRIRARANGHRYSDAERSGGLGFDEQHWGSGGSYLLGHPEIGAAVDAIHPYLLSVEFNPVYAPTMGSNARELFSRHAWNLSAPKYLDFPQRGIFSVLLGGGATTGVVGAVGDPSSWVRTRLAAYRENPVTFEQGKRRTIGVAAQAHENGWRPKPVRVEHRAMALPLGNRDVPAAPDLPAVQVPQAHRGEGFSRRAKPNGQSTDTLNS
ncbi:hypothetical protein PHO31112_01860 [Pandoraea horticolens]|uniref:Hydroxymethyltransferase n=1 Tax=Pandoraea horticolens TaxID=2508298 RepID=A0A5E4U6R6_9BURK|nr:hypothetical protein [Pandoraea horticolens]VVD95750.1 hypothetical protein PHO31112_01860 [Pandoraea horticolens]